MEKKIKVETPNVNLNSTARDNTIKGNNSASIKKADIKDIKIKKTGTNKVGRPKKYTTAQQLKDAKSAWNRKYYQKKKAEKAVKKTTKEWAKAHNAWSTVSQGTIRDAYDASTPEEWDNLNGSDIGYLIDNYGYDDTTLVDILEDLEQNGEHGTSWFATTRIMADMLGIRDAFINYREAEEVLQMAQEEYETISNAPIEKFWPQRKRRKK